MRQPLWPGDERIITNTGTTGVDPPGTSVPEGASTNTYGADTQLISAANKLVDTYALRVAIYETAASAAATECAVDILTGDDPEDVLISSLLCGGAYAATVRSYWFPIYIPAGVRIACRLSSVRTGITNPQVAIWLYGGHEPTHPVGSRVVTYGTKINNSRGQAITPAVSGGAAAVTQLVAATSEDLMYLMPGYQVSVDTTVTAGVTAVGIGLGASTEERIGTWMHHRSAAEHQMMTPDQGVFRRVPSNTRLTLLTSNSTGSNDSDQDGLIYGVAA